MTRIILLSLLACTWLGCEKECPAPEPIECPAPEDTRAILREYRSQVENSASLPKVPAAARRAERQRLLDVMYEVLAEAQRMPAVYLDDPASARACGPKMLKTLPRATAVKAQVVATVPTSPSQEDVAWDFAAAYIEACATCGEERAFCLLADRVLADLKP